MEVKSAPSTQVISSSISKINIISSTISLLMLVVATAESNTGQAKNNIPQSPQAVEILDALIE